MNIKQFFYIWRNKKFLYDTKMIFPSSGVLNYPLVLFIDNSDNIWENIGYAVGLLNKYKGYVLISKDYIPFWLFMGGQRSSIKNNMDDFKDSIYISFSDVVSDKEKYIISKIKSKYRFSFNWYEYPYINIVPSKNGLKNIFNIDLLRIDWNSMLSVKDTEDSIFVDKQNRKSISIVENFNGKVYFSGVYWKGSKKVIYVHDNNMVKSLVISKRRLLSSRLIISFCKYFNLRYEKI